MGKTESTGWALLLRKAGAFWLDIAFSVMFLVWPFLGLFEKSIPTTGVSATITFLSEHPQTVFSLNIISLFVCFIVMAYFILLQRLTGSTIGMLAFSLRVVPTNPHLHWWQCIVRNLFLILFFPFILLLLTEAGSLIWSRGEVRLLERLSQTRTVHEACGGIGSGSKHI